MWPKKHGELLKLAFDLFSIQDEDVSKKIHITESAIKQWKRGRNFPSKALQTELYSFLENHIKNNITSAIHEEFYRNIKEIIKETELSIIEYSDDIVTYYISLLKVCTLKNKKIYYESSIDSIGSIQAVVFDFDGTLTKGSSGKTTWETIWTELGYDVKICRELHKKFDKNEITHKKWCEITQEYFQKKDLNKSLLLKIANNIKLLKGTKKTFDILTDNNIKIYIVSGSILFIIQSYMNFFKASIFCDLSSGINNYDYLDDNFPFSSVLFWSELYERIGVYKFITESDESVFIGTVESDEQIKFLESIQKLIKSYESTQNDIYMYIDKLPNRGEVLINDENAYLKRIMEVRENINSLIENKEKTEQGENNMDEVFVVHGRNEKIKDSLFDFLEAINIKPLEWEEVVRRTGTGTPTTLEVIEAVLNLFSVNSASL